MRLVGCVEEHACPACVQPNFQGGEAKGEDRPENAGLKTRDAPIRADMRDKSAKRARAPIIRRLLTGGVSK